MSDFDRDRGTLTMVMQAVGKTTSEMMELAEGDRLLDVVGPLGRASKVERRSLVVLVGGGLGVAPIFPLLRRHVELGSDTISVVGFRSTGRAFWTERFQALSDELFVATDDGSLGAQGTVADVLADAVRDRDDVAEVFAIGPLPMMQHAPGSRGLAGSAVVSLNSIMVDAPGCAAAAG